MKRIPSLVIPGIILVILLVGSFIIVSSLSFVSPARKYRVVVLVKTNNDEVEFWVSVKSGVLAAAREYNLDLTIDGPMIESLIDEQIEIMDRVIREKPDAIILASSDYNALAPSVERAYREGISVITLDSGVNSILPLCFVATNNIEAGEKAARAMIELLEPGVEVAVVSHVKSVTTAIEREEGVRRAFEQGGTNRIVGTWYTDNFEEKAYANTLEILASYPDIGGIMALNEVSTVGVARALADLRPERRVRLVGFDSSLDEIKFIEEGIIDATVVQKPFNMGYLAVQKAWEALRGRRIERFVYTGSILITRGNLYTPENQKILFPFVEK